ncbi:hypothetical protein SEA_KINGBOB_47 [Arthrobacter phage KingBob]|uniref:dATP/dGTP diphosphohydrolase N-terminal domain-containing protein n=1 Tax=Arthrobacter phage Sergei TaxID=2250416 RepID=A0A345KPY5_9CAUD|nr:hypothetical protein KDJ06_gp47 [Arthrobacter phage Sergei]ASZ74361.1 hypothetical protein TEMPER16_47 [Arthrobacter phage Temper16]AXH43974.1 hypothetical protein SEA_DAIBOJU_47 [Arthrobacter phage Daiboju]AXH44036.1 hypothetical protein SEA_HERB_47 [Arthrobacter phage Herb]AXH44280.1 hypothetical protein SEA_KINGBOB_47 [Arthrobacter phage KingBob]QGJ97187.1 hypothetical protein SEA_MARIA1952_46 [Arthrobacter phage Maria1952]
MADIIEHALNCASLIPTVNLTKHKRLPCSCGAEDARKPSEGREAPEAVPASPSGTETPSVPLEQVGELEEGEQGLSGLFKLHGVGLSEEAQEGVLANLRRARILDLSVGEVRSVSSTGAEKGVKEARFDLIPVGPLEQLAIHFGRGAQKYEPHNWRKGYELSKGYAALQRHANAWWAGENLDPEIGTSHLAAVAFHALALLELLETHPEMDDRFII